MKVKGYDHGGGKVTIMTAYFPSLSTEDNILSVSPNSLDHDQLEKDFPFFTFSKNLDHLQRLEEYGLLCTEIDQRVSEENRFHLELEKKIQELQEIAWKKLDKEVKQYFKDYGMEARHEVNREYKAYTGLSDSLDSTRYVISKQCNELSKYLTAHNDAWRPPPIGNKLLDLGGDLKNLTLKGVVAGLEGISKLTAKDNVSPEHENPPQVFIKRILERHFSDRQLENFLNKTLTNLQSELGKSWEAWLTDDSKNFTKEFKSELSIEWSDPSLETAKLLGISAVGGTIALAMGWHTLAWSLANFFPPALLAAGVIAAGWTLLSEKEVKKRLEESIDKTVNNLEKELQRVLAVEAMPGIRDSLKKMASIAIETRGLYLWKIPDDPEPRIRKWRPLLIQAIDSDQKRWTFAQAEHMMNDAFEKGFEAVSEDEVEKAVLYFSLSFDGFVHWSHRKTGIELNTFEKNYLAAYEKRYEAAGWGSSFCSDFNSVRRLRNDGIHDYYKQDNKDFAKELKDGYRRLGELIQLVKDK